MLMPKKVKYRKQQRGVLRGKAARKTKVDFGSFGLKALGNSWVTARQIEAARRSMTHFLKRGGKLWIRIFPDKSISLKGGEMSMGKGKGPVDHYVACVKKGTVMFEIDGVSTEIAKEAMRLASHKLPVKTRFLVKE